MTILLNAVFNPPLEIFHRLGQQLLIDREHFLLDGILQLVQITGFVSVHLQLVQITGFVSVHTALQVPPEEEITLWQVRRPWGPWYIAETRNEAPREHVSKKVHWCVRSVRCGTILLKINISHIYSTSSHPARSAHDRSTAVGPSDGRFQAEDWKLHSREWSSPKWHYFSYLNT